jgi:hypothetical protein
MAATASSLALDGPTVAVGILGRYQKIEKP